MEKFDAYRKHNEVSNWVKRVQRDDRINPHNKELLLKFKDHILTLDLSLHRVLFYLIRVIEFARWILDRNIEDLTKDDLKVLIGEKVEHSDYKPWTKHACKLAIRNVYKWLEGHEWYDQFVPERLDWMRLHIKKTNTKLPQDLLSPDDVKKMVNATQNIKFKALIATLYESGARISELLGLRIKDLKFNGMGCKVMLNGKTGTRPVFLVSSTRLLADWLNQHPDNSSPDAFIFPNTSNNQLRKGSNLTYQMTSEMLKRVA